MDNNLVENEVALDNFGDIKLKVGIGKGLALKIGDEREQVFYTVVRGKSPIAIGKLPIESDLGDELKDKEVGYETIYEDTEVTICGICSEEFAEELGA